MKLLGTESHDGQNLIIPILGSSAKFEFIFQPALFFCLTMDRCNEKGEKRREETG